MRNITIVGIGALGSNLVPLLRNMSVKITVIDFDRTEQKNLKAQFHARNSVGKPKTLALTQLMQFLYNIKLNGIPHKLTDNNTYQLLKDADLVVDCLDNFEARTLVQEHVRKHKIPCVHGALSADGSFGRVIWDEEFKIDSEASQGQATCENGDHLPFIMMTVSALAQSIKMFLTTGKYSNFNVTPNNITQF